MTDNILLIEEKEKENAKALSQSFTRADVKSRAYVNALGAEVCLKYLQNNEIASETTYNLHNIRKVLEEFDISDIMLSNIHIDVRVVYDENRIFIPKSHFDFGMTPDIYVVLKSEKDYSKMELLGFFEPKLINTNNANENYYFIEKEKLSSPVDLKNYIQNFQGSTSQDISEQDFENAEFLIVSMADNNITEEDKKQLISYLKNCAGLRENFTEFENFEMLAYQSINVIDDVTENNNSIETPIENLTIDDIVEDIDTQKDLAIGDNSMDGFFDALEENNTDNNTLEDMLKGTAVLGAEIAGAAVVSGALAGAGEGAEIVKDAVQTIETTGQVVENIAEGFVSDNNSETPADENNNADSNGEINNPEMSDIDSFISNTLINENSNTEMNTTPQDLTNETTLDILFNDEQNEETDSKNPTESIYDENNNEYEDLIFENNDEEYSNFNIPEPQSLGLPALESPIIPPTTHTPISEATELFSLESLQLGEIPTLETSKDELETMTVDDFQNLIDNYECNPISNESEIGVYNSITENISENINQNSAEGTVNTEMKLEESTSDNFVQDMPEETIDTELKLDELTSDNFVQDMPEETVDTELKLDELTSDNFVQDMPEETIDTELKLDELTSDNFVQDMPEETIDTELKLDELASDNFVQDMPEETVDTELKLDELTSDNFVQDMPEETVDTELKLDELTSDNFVQDMPEETVDTELKLDELTSDNFVQDMPEETVDTELKLDELTSDNFVQDMPLENIEEQSGFTLGDLEDFTEQSNEIQTENTSTVIENAEENISEVSSMSDNIPSLNDLDEINTIENVSEDENVSSDETPAIGVLYDANGKTEIDSSELEDELPENYDFRPAKKTNLIPVFAIAAAILIAGSVVGFLVKSKNSIDSETLINSSIDDSFASPETDNSNILANGNAVEPAIPTEMEDIAPAPAVEKPSTPAVKKETKQTMVKNAKEAIKQPQSTTPKKPLNASKTITLKKVSWNVPEYLSYSDNIRKYLQTAGKSIKLTLSSDLLLTNEYIYSNQVKVNITLTKDGNIKDAKITSSSGSNQVDKIVLQTVKDTLNVVKPPQGEVPTPSYNLGLIISL